MLQWLQRAMCRVSIAGRPDDDATALTSSPHGILKHRGRGRDLAALQQQVVAKLGRQVCHRPWSDSKVYLLRNACAVLPLIDNGLCSPKHKLGRPS